MYYFSINSRMFNLLDVSQLWCSYSCRFMGGNSTKATSGINGAGTQTQQELGIPDSSKIFFEDTKRSVSIRSILHLLLLHCYVFGTSGWLVCEWLGVWEGRTPVSLAARTS